jgi:hypothetical protein
MVKLSADVILDLNSVKLYTNLALYQIQPPLTFTRPSFCVRILEPFWQAAILLKDLFEKNIICTHSNINLRCLCHDNDFYLFFLFFMFFFNCFTKFIWSLFIM